MPTLADGTSRLAMAAACQGRLQCQKSSGKQLQIACLVHGGVVDALHGVLLVVRPAAAHRAAADLGAAELRHGGLRIRLGVERGKAVALGPAGTNGAAESQYSSQLVAIAMNGASAWWQCTLCIAMQGSALLNIKSSEVCALERS